MRQHSRQQLMKLSRITWINNLGAKGTTTTKKIMTKSCTLQISGSTTMTTIKSTTQWAGPTFDTMFKSITPTESPTVVA